MITLGDFRPGVQLAPDSATRTLRQARFAAVRSTFEPIPIDEPIAARYGEVLAIARSRKHASKATDLLIIATASATGRVLYTLDERQARLAEVVDVDVRH